MDLLREPIHGESDERNQANDLAVAAASSSIVARRVVARVVVGIDCDKCDGEPSAKSHGDESSDERHEVYMTKLLRDVDRGLQHQNAEGDARDPADEADHVEDAEDQEDNASRPVAARKHVKRRDEAEDDVQDTGDPDKLLGEGARCPHVGVGQDRGHTEDEGEQDDGVRVQRELVATAVDGAVLILRCKLSVLAQTFSKDADPTISPD